MWVEQQAAKLKQKAADEIAYTQEEQVKLQLQNEIKTIIDMSNAQNTLKRESSMNFYQFMSTQLDNIKKAHKQIHIQI